MPGARRFVLSAVLVLAVLLNGCSSPSEPSPPPPVTDRPAGVITLGDIDAEEPATRVRRIQPLADHLAAQLHDHGIGRGHVVIARDIGEMSRMMAEGKVDIYLDSPFPVLAVNREANSTSVLLRQAKEDAQYWTIFIARADSALNSLADIRGKVAVFQEPHSTSGFLLPVSSLLDQGYTLRAVARLDADVTGDDIGCHFSGDEENTIELVLNGTAEVGAISNQDFRDLPEPTRERLKVLHETDKVPRQLVSLRKDLDPALSDAVRNALLSISDEDRRKMAQQDAPLGWTWRFAELTAESRKTLTRLEAKMDLLPACIAAR